MKNGNFVLFFWYILISIDLEKERLVECIGIGWSGFFFLFSFESVIEEVVVWLYLGFGIIFFRRVDGVRREYN